MSEAMGRERPGRHIAGRHETWKTEPRMTHDKIAARLGVTRQMVQKIELRALRKLAAGLASGGVL